MAETSTPAFAVYTVIEREKQDPFWLRIGAAWVHSDGKGYNVTLDALPHNGRIVLRLPKVEEEEPAKPTKKR
jgi:hypothetical protein